MRVRIAEAASHDLDRVTGLISDDADFADVELAKALQDLALDVGTSPRLYSPVPWREHIRKRQAPPYLILYEIRPTEILILRIVHERSDWASLI